MVKSDRGDGGARQGTEIQPVFNDEVDSQEGRDDRAPEVDGDDRAGSFSDHGDHIRHPVKEHRPPRPDLFRRQLIDRDIDVASQKREQQKGKDIPLVDAHLLIGITERVDFDQDNQRQKEKQEQEEEWQGDGKVLYVGGSLAVSCEQ
jgi:hypothetical protein